MSRLSRLASTSSIIVNNFRQQIEELIKSGKVDPDVQVKLIASPYYRTLETARMVAEGLENKIFENTIFVEVFLCNISLRLRSVRMKKEISMHFIDHIDGSTKEIQKNWE